MLITSVADSQGTITNEQGLDIVALEKHKQSGQPLKNFKSISGTDIHGDSTAVLYTECDVLIPAALDSVITESNVAQVQAKTILEPATIQLVVVQRYY